MKKFFLGLLIIFTFCFVLHSSGAVVPGHVEGWGLSYFGEAKPPPANDIIAISAGLNYGLALRSTGTVLAWGSNYEGQTNVPPGLSNVVAIFARLHSVALKADGTVVVWGSNHPKLQSCAISPSGHQLDHRLYSSRSRGSADAKGGRIR